MKGFGINWLVALALVVSTSMAYADGGKLSTPNNKKWKDECGSCHVAYPPQLLTAENWQRVMGGMDKHFGVNASMDAKDSQEILDFLQRNAGSGARHSAASLRISETAWFTREHHEVSGKTWANPAIKSRSNCVACHVNGERGDWSERGIRMPGGQHRDDDE